MPTTRVIAILAIALGALAFSVLALLSGLGGGWLWAGALVVFALAAVFLYVYARGRGYDFLIAGSLLMGLAVGLLLGSVGAILIGLGVGFFVIDRLEPRTASWPLYPAGTLAALGVLVYAAGAGPVGWTLLALLLVALGALLLSGREGKGWTYAGPPSPERGSPTAQASTAQVSTTRVPMTQPFTSPPHATPTPPTPSTSPTPPNSPTTPKPAAAPTPPVPAEHSSQSSPESEVVKNALQGSEDVQAAEAEAETPLTEADAGLYRRLESWRKTTAKSEERPAYIVLTNDAMRRIAREKPRTVEALKRIKGIGPVKLERYGEEILALVQDERGLGEGIQDKGIQDDEIQTEERGGPRTEA